MAGIHLPALSAEFEPTRATLHAYARAVGTIARTHGIADPRWWHSSLKVRPEGLVTNPIPLPAGGTLALTMDLKRTEIAVRSSTGADHHLDLRSGLTGTEMGDRLASLAETHGLVADYDRARFESDEPRVYDLQAADAYFDAFVAVSTVFERHRVTLGTGAGPIQLWPHGFDLAFEWYGNTESQADPPAQLSLGFYPGGDRPYFYSNPWPFDEELTDTPLPHGAIWHTEGWRGAMLPYDIVQGEPEAESMITQFACAVIVAAAPTLWTR